MINVLCVDDNRDLAGLISLAVDSEQDMCSAGTLHNADGLLEAIDRDPPDVIILDLSMPGMDPMNALEQVTAKHPNTRVVVFSGRDDRELVDRAIESGAWGYVSKHGDIDAILKAVRRVASGEFAVDKR